MEFHAAAVQPPGVELGEELGELLGGELGELLGGGVGPPNGLAMMVTVRCWTPQPSACVPGSQTSTVSFWIHVPMSAA